MASDQAFVDYVLEQIKLPGELEAKKMFGEYGVFLDAKVFALICDNKLFVKPTEEGKAYIKNIVEAPPYPGAKPSLLIEEKLDDSEWLTELCRITWEGLPAPKPKKKKNPTKK